MKIKVIIGSTRQNRFGDKPAHYIYEQVKMKEGVEAELLDLRDYPIPFYEDSVTPKMIKGNYTNDVVRKWAEKIKDADAFIIVTPEYNHGYPAVLKNAIDSIFYEWNNKVVGFVGYGSAGGARSIEQLRQVVIELQMIPIRNAIHIPSDVYMAVMKEKIPVNPDLFSPLRKSMMGDRVEMFFDDLLWSTKAMMSARQATNR